MIQGTASSVGKSLITTGLCRIFKQEGYTVVPFKSQNMALNSFITTEGKEMGRAQVVQAEAAGVEPNVKMNPILLKPTTDKKAQVIINGEVYKNMSAIEYHNFKPELAGIVRDIYNELSENNDIVVIEGAGSPAEINLREKDIVNMGMAEIADAPVILVGDIDKGGVFASLVGTIQLLTEKERKRIKGVIINKFRGDLNILKPGIEELESIIKIPVLGVVPYAKLNIEDEDSLAERFNTKNNKNYDIDIAVIRLPHISNFTDFNALENIEGVRVRFVEQKYEIGNPDMIILPGTKNTIEDMEHIRKLGIETEIIKLNKQGTLVFGICGGYQMLGMEIEDHSQTESELLNTVGMGLLNIKTEFKTTKRTVQVVGEIIDFEGVLEHVSNKTIEGYEIHMGISECYEGCIPFAKIHTVLGDTCEHVGGVKNISGTVYGTYIHGIFDNVEVTASIINSLRIKKGLTSFDKSNMSYKEYKETQYNLLADIIRQNINMDLIYKIVRGN